MNKVYNSETLCVEESMHIKFDDKEPRNETPQQGESFADMQVHEDTSKPDQTPESQDSLEAKPTPEVQDEVASNETQNGSQQANQSNNTFKYKCSHLEDLIVGNKESPKRTRSYFRQEESMQEELNQFQRNDVWDLVPKPQDKNITGTKWVFKNKLNEQGEVVRNKARLVAQG